MPGKNSQNVLRPLFDLLAAYAVCTCAIYHINSLALLRVTYLLAAPARTKNFVTSQMTISVHVLHQHSMAGCLNAHKRCCTLQTTLALFSMQQHAVCIKSISDMLSSMACDISAYISACDIAHQAAPAFSSQSWPEPLRSHQPRLGPQHLLHCFPLLKCLLLKYVLRKHLLRKRLLKCLLHMCMV